MAQRIKRLAWILVILLLLVFIPTGFFRSDLLDVVDVVCKTQYGPCDKKDNSKLLEFYSQNLFSVSGREITEKMKEDFQNRNVYVQKIFPRTLVVILDKRKAFVVLRGNGLKSGEVFVDSDGVVIGVSERSSLPTLTLWPDATFTVGEKVSGKIKQAARLLFTVNRTQQAQTGKYENEKNDFFTVDLPREVKVYFPLDKEPDVLVGALQLILTRSRIDGKMPKSIDLRYSNPMLVY